MPNTIAIDDQPISATFFGEGRWLTDFITPDAIDIKELHKDLTQGIASLDEKIAAMHNWVASQIRYTRFVKGKLSIEGKSSVQDDLWNLPSITARVKVGNCACKAFLLCSLIRNSLPSNQSHVVLGNLSSDSIGGHAWCLVNQSGNEYILEATRSDMPIALASRVEIYEPVIVFNDQEASIIEGRVVKEPMGYCCVSWLKDYLDMRRCDEFIGVR